MMDYRSLLFDPIYLTFGVSASLALAAGASVEGLTVIDHTSGVDVGDGAQVQTIVPVAFVRVFELTARGVTVDQLPKALLLMNGFEWRVTSYRLRPSPNGEREGEAMLLLAAKREA